jgi:hypothetical protein
MEDWDWLGIERGVFICFLFGTGELADAGEKVILNHLETVTGSVVVNRFGIWTLGCLVRRVGLSLDLEVEVVLHMVCDYLVFLLVTFYSLLNFVESRVRGWFLLQLGIEGAGALNCFDF